LGSLIFSEHDLWMQDLTAVRGLRHW
jgi:hypothetical protein